MPDYGFLPDVTPPGTAPAPTPALPPTPTKGGASSPIKRKYRGAPPRKKHKPSAGKPPAGKR